MNLVFRLRFHTEPGQSLFLTGTTEELGDGRTEKAIPMQFLDSEHWQAVVSMKDRSASQGPFHYEYIFRYADGTTVRDWGMSRRMDPAGFREAEVLILDSWNSPSFPENAFYTEPFRNVLLADEIAAAPGPIPTEATHTFRVKAPLLQPGQALCLLGEADILGRWNTANPKLLSRVVGEDALCLHLNLRGQSLPLEYKYGVYDTREKKYLHYEAGPNRCLPDTVGPRQYVVVDDGFARLSANTWKGAGVAIPVFSLRSESGFGVGEFVDLKRLADWSRGVGLKLIQILPINDTTATHGWADSYPYAAISAFALHPIYLSLQRVASPANQGLLQELESERRRLNGLDALDYEAVMKIKREFLAKIYPSQCKATFESLAYQEFFANNRRWLEPYAAFCWLRDLYGTSEFRSWPECRVYQADAVAALAARTPAAQEAIGWNYFVQFHLHQQLQEATTYSHSRGVVLKGDLPIGVSRSGADIWQQPELFREEFQAGAPPDAFAVKGQNWGFPTYNWPKMKLDGFAWWRHRFEQMGHYFDAFRIDHILGFFRIWSIPNEAVEGILGYFVPAIPVHVAEFGARGVWFDRRRYTRPYITDAVLSEIFGSDAEAVRAEFLRFDGYGEYSLKPEFATQLQVDRHFASFADTGPRRKIRAGLFDLISNVILFEVQDSKGQQFHFRFGIDTTTSFHYLPPRVQPLLMDLYVNYFFRRQDDFWMKEAMGKLPALKRVTNMLICGEDLGLVPACVPEAMRQLGLLSLEIQRMPKRMGQEFFRPAEAPYLSVVTPSSHDMSTIRGWWEEDRALTQRFFNNELGQAGTAPEKCEPWINRAVVLQHLKSPAMWSIFQLQDLLGSDGELRRADPAAERINVPANPLNQWRYRMHLTLETLQKADRFNAELKKLVQESGR